MSPRQQRTAWAAAIVAGALLPFAPAVVGLRTLSQRDTDRLLAPVRTLVVEAIRDGRLPLWNPYEGLGKPLFAEGIHSVLHPISLLGAAIAPSSIDFLILGYVAAAALGAFALARTLGASCEAAAGSGIAFALSGYSVSMTGFLTFLAGLSTLPWLLAAARAAGEGHRWGTVLTGLATAAAFFSGDTQVALIGLALAILLSADAGGTRGAARAAIGVCAGLLLSAVQIAATQGLLTQSTRASGLTDWEQMRWPLAPARLLEWVIPGLFRGPTDEMALASSGASLEPVFAGSVYLGAPLLLAAALGGTSPAAKASRRTRILLACASGLILWLALGHHLGARQLLDWVPVWSRFRYPEKLMAPLALCLCALGALGVDAFATGPLRRRWTRVAALAALGALLAFTTLAIADGPTQRLATRLLGDEGPFYRSTVLAGLPHLAIGLATLLAIDRSRRERARAILFAILVAATPAFAVYYGAHLGRHEARVAPPVQLESGSPSPRLIHPADRTSAIGGLQDPVERDARFYSQLLITAVNVAHRVETIGFYGAFEPSRLREIIDSLDVGWANRFRRFGVTHVAVPIPHDALDREAAALAVDGGRLVLRDERLGFEYWAVPHRPWAFFADRGVAAASLQQARAFVHELITRRDDATVAVTTLGALPTAPGRVLHVERAPASVQLLAESQGPALLVVQDAWWPGWRATVDGEPTTLLMADALVRAVRTPAGRHRIEMTYDPPEVRFGLALSVVGAVALLGLAARAARTSRQERLG